jgi:hypothetical protein
MLVAIVPSCFHHSAAGKPLVLEEFGFPRDGGSLNPNATTRGRDMMYSAVFKVRCVCVYHFTAGYLSELRQQRRLERASAAATAAEPQD